MKWATKAKAWEKSFANSLWILNVSFIMINIDVLAIRVIFQNYAFLL